MSAKFTPGPWHASYSKFSQVKAANGAIVATCNRLSNLVNLQANANLIAAAPDLFSVLDILEWVDGPDGGPPFCPICGQDIDHWHRDGCRLNDALKKARGES